MLMRTRMRWLVFFLLLASVPAMACGLFTDDGAQDGAQETDEGATESVEEVPTSVPAAPTVDLGDGGQQDAPPLPDIVGLSEALSQFNSYRVLVEMRFEETEASDRSGSMTLDTRRTVQPPASQVLMTVSGAFGADLPDLGQGASLTFVEIEGTSYSVIPGVGCISGAGGSELAGEFDGVVDTDEWISEIENAEFVGDETVNGVATHHYRLDETSFSDSDNQLQEATGDLYVSQEHGYVVRMEVEGIGEMDLFDEGGSQGMLSMTMDVLDVDQPFVIEPPEGCDASGSEFPVMDGSRDLATFAGLTTYVVDASLNDVVTFYQNEMAALGYELEADPLITDSTALLTFSAEGMPTVSITLGAEGNTISVLLSSEDN